MVDDHGNNDASGVSRRRFIGALGAVAAVTLGGEGARAKGVGAAPVYYKDSFGNIVPAAADSVAAGVYPPPVSAKPAADGGVSPDYVSPNILLIMVDQMRAPRWLTSQQQTFIDNHVLPNIAALRNSSYVFPNYFTCATNCTPARATLLTGLYSQQTCMFETQNSGLEPSLQTGFPNIGNVLSSLGYDTTWIGKWHLSAAPGQTGAQRGNGPVDYGFNNPYCIPTPPTPNPNTYSHAYVSPNATENLASSGDFLNGGVPQNYPTHFSGLTPPTGILLNDAAVADAFIGHWLPHAPASPWFAAVSFLNPHDLSLFPYAYGLATGTGYFGVPSHPNTRGYQPPPVQGGSYPGTGSKPENTYFPPLSKISPYTLGSPPANFNNGDDPANQPYTTKNSQTGQYGKPSVQAYFQNNVTAGAGKIENTDTNGWLTFLNYYFWMQSVVDHQIGRVMQSLGSLLDNTVVMFLSDHGDYGGSHNLHAKGGALYDEVINVPLYISYPSMRTSKTSITRSFVCSSVDILPFLYYLATGDESWRTNPSNVIYYLNQRESIADAINLGALALQRRLSSIPCFGTNQNGQTTQPYILHTMDEYATADGTAAHAIAFRTVDVTVQPSGPGSYGGGKLGMYSFWASCSTCPTMNNSAYPQQFEFYNYAGSSPNPGEVGNLAVASINPTTGQTTLTSQAQSFLNSFHAIAPNELYQIFPQLSTLYQAAFDAYMTFVGATCAPPVGEACTS